MWNIKLGILVSPLRAVLVTTPTVYHGFFREPSEGENYSNLQKAWKTPNENQVKEQSYLFISLGRVESSYWNTHWKVLGFLLVRQLGDWGAIRHHALGDTFSYISHWSLTLGYLLLKSCTKIKKKTPFIRSSLVHIIICLTVWSSQWAKNHTPFW